MAQSPAVELHFRGTCPDCGVREVKLPAPLADVGDDFDWLVRDYDGFRMFMLEELAARFPERKRWTPADLEVVLIEVMATILDHLSDMADRVAAFGGCIALNRSVDKATAEAIVQQYAEVVVAPDFEPGVMDVFATKKNLRVIKIGNIDRLQSFVGQRCVEFKSLIDGGIVAQWSFVPEARTRADLKLAECEYKGNHYRIQREPTDEEYNDMLFGWLVESGITSNSVIYVKDQVTVGIGTGEQDRVGVAEIARDKAYRKLADRYCFEMHGMPYNDLTDDDKKAEIDDKVGAEKGGLIGAVMVSDAFFSFQRRCRCRTERRDYIGHSCRRIGERLPVHRSLQ